MRFVAVIEWQVQPRWFELDPRTRLDYTRQMHEIIGRYPDLRFRWFDAEAWTGKFTDFALCEFDDLDTYNSLWGELRRHPFLATPFAYASRVTMGMELEPPPELCPICANPLKATTRFCGGCGAPNPGRPERPVAE